MQDAFTKLFNDAGQPMDAGLYIDSETDIYYFSPKAVDIAEALLVRFGGRACPAPRSSAVDTLVGNKSRAAVPFASETE